MHLNKQIKRAKHMQNHVPDFDHYLLPRARMRLHHTKAYRQYIELRLQTSVYIASHEEARASESTLLRIRELEALGKTLYAVMECLQSEEANRRD